MWAVPLALVSSSAPPFKRDFEKGMTMALRKPPAAPRAPAHLADPTRAWWRSVVEKYELEDHHLRLLTLAAESWDRCEAARKAIGEHGLTYLDRFNSPHARPEIAIERDSKIAFARLLRELDLDVEPPPAASRPASLRSNRG
jgi:phage terminase small subunit